MRRTYESPRKANKEHLYPKISFLNANSSQEFDFKQEITPKWTLDWEVQATTGGLVFQEDSIKEKRFFRQIKEYNPTATIKKESSDIYFPVDVLSPESDLERLVEALSYAPSLFGNS